MGRGWLLSSLLHAALAVMLWLGLPGWGRPLPAIESGITVEVVSEAELAPPAPEIAAVAPEPERQAARPEPARPRPEPEPEPVARPEPEAVPPEPEPVRAEPEPPPEPEPEPEQQAALEPPQEPEPPKPAPPAALPKPLVKPAPAPEPQPAKAAPKPRPEPAQARAEPPKPEPPKAEPPQPEPPRPEPPKPMPAMAPKSPPEPKQPEPPKQDEFTALLRSVEEMDRRAQGEVRQDGTGRNPEGTGRARTTIGEAALSRGEVDAVMRQIGGCWTLPAGIDGIEEMVVRLRIQVRPDRTVQGATIEDQARLNRDPTFRAVAESARRAVERCSPLNLPPDKYALWRDIVMNFYPQYAISGG